MGNSKLNYSKIELIDNGGFINSERSLPYPDRAELSQDPDLSIRALHGAFASVALMMFYLNVSYPNNTGPRNTSLGRRFPIEKSWTSDLNSIDLTKIISPKFLTTTSTDYKNLSSNLTASAQAKLGVSESDWRDAERLCQGTTGKREPNISLVHVRCGFLYGAPQPLFSEDPRIFQPQSRWKQSLYMCASGARASVKTVDFSVNGTATLDNLRIIDVKDKLYKDNASKPLWGLEKTYASSFDAAPLWGIIDNRFENAPDLHTLRAEKFWIPTSGSALSGIELGGSDNLASAKAIASGLNSVYSSTSGLAALGLGEGYSGENNIALFQYWQKLSQSPSTAAKIINLIYTELLATGTVGTKSAINSLNSGGGSNTRNRVAVYERRLQYKIVYAIPAFIVLALVLLVSLALLYSLLTCFSPKKLSTLLNQTSTGRVVTNLVYPELGAKALNTKDWAHAAGGVELEYPFTKKGAVRVLGKKEWDQSDRSNGSEEEAKGLKGGTQVQESGI
ncbi:MAG: hypothetical protein Q9166_007926 [cf. Caloplaca sp. 2 TL-2023]